MRPRGEGTAGSKESEPDEVVEGQGCLVNTGVPYLGSPRQVECRNVVEGKACLVILCRVVPCPVCHDGVVGLLDDVLKHGRHGPMVGHKKGRVRYVTAPNED